MAIIRKVIPYVNFCVAVRARLLFLVLVVNLCLALALYSKGHRNTRSSTNADTARQMAMLLMQEVQEPCARACVRVRVFRVVHFAYEMPGWGDGRDDGVSAGSR